MKTASFFTIHQAPHNTYTFKCLEKKYKVNVIYLNNRLSNYGWNSHDFYYPGETDPSLYRYIKIALNSDINIISGWHSYKYIILIIVLFIFKRNFGVYLDLDPDSLKKYGIIKKVLLRNVPFVLITGVFGERFLQKYLKRDNIYNFPYGIEVNNTEVIKEINEVRVSEIQVGDKIRVFISNRFIDRKGYHLVRSLIEYLKEHNLLDKFQFTIAGNGPLFDEEKEALLKIDNSIILLGWIEYSLYKELMLNTDIYLHCSKFEPYGIPPIDAFLCKKTIVVSSRVYSLYDIIELGGKVHIFKYKDANGLHSIFDWLVKNSDKIYNSNSHMNFERKRPYLFCDKHMHAVGKILNSKS